MDTIDARVGNALTYIMNAVFVLMTTNFSLNPEGGGLFGATNANSYLCYFPLFQVFLSVLYASLKVYTSDY